MGIGGVGGMKTTSGGGAATMRGETGIVDASIGIGIGIVIGGTATTGVATGVIIGRTIHTTGDGGSRGPARASR